MISKVYEQKLQKDLFKLSIMTLITTIIWIGMVTYKALVKSEIKPDVKKQLILLTPTLELDTIDSIKKRQTIPEENWVRSGVATPSATLTEIEAPAATGSAND